MFSNVAMQKNAFTIAEWIWIICKMTVYDVINMLHDLKFGIFTNM